MNLEYIQKRIKDLTADDRISDLSNLQYEILDSDIEREHIEQLRETKKYADLYNKEVLKSNDLIKELYKYNKEKNKTCENCKHKKVCFINTKVNQVAIVQGLEPKDFSCSLWEKN